MFDVYMIVIKLIKCLSEARHNLYSTKKNVDAANRHWMEINYNCLHILVIHRICSKKETIKCYASEYYATSTSKMISLHNEYVYHKEYQNVILRWW